MTKMGPSRDAQTGEWRGRFLNAKGFHKAARELMDLHDDGENGNPIVVRIVHAAIA